jgi:hypothetical protein
MLEWTDQHSQIADRPSPAPLGYTTLSHIDAASCPFFLQVAEMAATTRSQKWMPSPAPLPCATSPSAWSGHRLPPSSLSATSCPLLPPSQLCHRRREAAQRLRGQLGDGDGSKRAPFPLSFLSTCARAPFPRSNFPSIHSSRSILSV